MKHVSLLGIVLLLEACASPSLFELGNRSARAGDWDAAVASYRQVQAREPENIEVRAALLRASLEASRAHLRLARKRRDASDLAGAASEFEIALEYDPTNRYAWDELEEIRASLSGTSAVYAPVRHERIFGPEPALDPASSALIDLKFAEPTSLRKMLETLGQLAGVHILFDESFRDREVTVDLHGVTFEEALDLILTTHGLYYKVVDSKTLGFGSSNPRQER